MLIHYHFHFPQKHSPREGVRAMKRPNYTVHFPAFIITIIIDTFTFHIATYLLGVRNTKLPSPLFHQYHFHFPVIDMTTFTLLLSSLSLFSYRYHHFHFPRGGSWDHGDAKLSAPFPSVITFTFQSISL